MTDMVIDLNSQRITSAHVSSLQQALVAFDEQHSERLGKWGAHLADVLLRGGRLLAVGNGGSAAQAQHLTAELVGRYLKDRRPFSAISLHAETSSVTAIVNDYGADQVFARQVFGHGRPGDVLFAMSTSGSSANVLEAVRAATEVGMTTWALTGRSPNPLVDMADDAVTVDADTPTVQEIHQVALHMLCESLDSVVIP